MKALIQKLKKDILDFSQGAIYAPSEKQAWYCAKLLAERGWTGEISNMFDSIARGSAVTGKEVGSLIDMLIKNPTMFKGARK